jgi:nicotinamidase-related amidase
MNHTPADPLLRLLQPLPPFELIPQKSALLVIDMQYLDAHPDFGLFARASELGLSETLRYYFERLQLIVPNISALLSAFRKEGLPVVYSRNMSHTPDGRDRSLGHKLLGVHAAPGSKESEILGELRPEPGDIVLSKTASGVFNATHVDYILRCLGVELVAVTGVVTNQCVETAVRDACDLGYRVILVEDACAAIKPQLHQASLSALERVYCHVRTADQLLGEIKTWNA